ncbi:hypothetical protein [Vibrio coralliirubri]|uniref:hypothetical protein n=1 Tax=Vibrio coralliirubri TaxID=1516159 RepID=UPI000A36BBF5|nr:hypothetical protein [Vibrio coralliirubri]
MLSRLATSIALGLISTGAYANSLEITSLSQTQGEKAESTYVGEPIVASKNGGAIFHFNKQGEENNYYWVNQENRVLAKGVVFIPSMMDANSQVRLCQAIVNTPNGLEEKVEVTCSNSLHVERGNPDLYNRSLRSTVLNIDDLWDIKQSVANDAPIYSGDETVKLELDLSYSGELTSLEEVLSSNEPKFAMVYYSIQDQNDNYLVSAQRYYPEEPSFVHSSLNETVTREADINLGDASVIKVCGIGFATAGSSTFLPLDCDTRVIEADETIDGWAKSPTAEQFSALFPGHSYIRSRSVNGVYYAASPLMSNNENLQEKYCESIGPNYSSPSTNELLLLKSAEDGYNSASWPAFTNYWSKDIVDGPFPIPGIVWNDTVVVSDDNSVQPADNTSYHGLFSCMKQK